MHIASWTMTIHIPAITCGREPKRPGIARLTAGHVGFQHTKGSVITDVTPRTVVEYSHDSRYNAITTKLIQEDGAIALCCIYNRRQ